MSEDTAWLITGLSPYEVEVAKRQGLTPWNAASNKTLEGYRENLRKQGPFPGSDPAPPHDLGTPVTWAIVRGRIRRLALSLVVLALLPFVLFAVAFGVGFLATADKAGFWLSFAKLASPYYSVGRADKVAYYEALRPVDASLKGLMASELYGGYLGKAPVDWSAMSPSEREAVVAAWARNRLDQGKFQSLPPKQLSFYRGAFDSYLTTLLKKQPDPVVAFDLGLLRRSSVGGAADMPGAVVALRQGRDYSSAFNIAQSTANEALLRSWLTAESRD